MSEKDNIVYVIEIFKLRFLKFNFFLSEILEFLKY